MAGECKNASKYQDMATPVPFKSVEEAWFWFIQAQQARNDGARIGQGAGLVNRPCEPVDILRVLDRLYRQRRLTMDHLLVLRHYGQRQMAPDPGRVKEYQASHLWTEALERLTPVLVRKAIIEPVSSAPSIWTMVAAEECL